MKRPSQPTTPQRHPVPAVDQPGNPTGDLSLPRVVEWTREILTCPAGQLHLVAQSVLARIAECLGGEEAALWTVRSSAGQEGAVARLAWHSALNPAEVACTFLSPELLRLLRSESPVEIRSALSPFASSPSEGSGQAVLCVPSWSAETLKGILVLAGSATYPREATASLPLVVDALMARTGEQGGEETATSDSERALRESVERLDEILVAAGVGVWSWRLSAVRSRVDERFLSLLGIGLDEWRGTIRDWYSLIHEDDRPLVDQQWDLHVAGEAPSYRAEYRIRSRDRGWRWILDVGKVKEWNEEGEPLFAIGAVIDRTDLRALEEQLRHSQKLEALGRMAGSVAHDFNNMISVINGFSELLLHSLSPESPEHSQALAIRAAAERASAITDELLSFSRPGTARVQCLDLNEVIQGISGMLRHLAGQEVDLEMQLHPEPVRVVAGKSQLEQILVNLALNAGDAMSAAGGTLTIRTEILAHSPNIDPQSLTAHPQALLTIEDTGAGMDEETLEHLFEPFFTSKPEGTGLGLSRTHDMLHEWGGTVEVRSRPGQGTTFHLRFPLAGAVASLPVS